MLMISEIWLLIGIICLIIEFTAIPNIGFLFFGFGALSNAILIYNYPLDFKSQIIIFGLMSFIWFAILWPFLKKYAYKETNHKVNNYSDMIGKTAEVYSDKIFQNDIGQVKWSGVIMNAKLLHGSSAIHKGEIVHIIEVQGNVLICTKK